MEPADLRERNDVAHSGRLNCARHGTVLIEGEMGPRLVVVGEVALQDTSQVLLVEDDDVIEALAPDASDHSFAERILPRTSCGGENFLDPESLDRARELAPVDAVAVAQKVSWAMFGFAEGDRLFDLKGGPVCRRRLCDIEVKHSSPVVGKDDEREQDAEGRGGDFEEVD